MVREILDGVLQDGSGSTTWVGLSDTPAGISPFKFVRGNSAGDALEFTTAISSETIIDAGAITAPNENLSIDNGGIV